MRRFRKRKEPTVSVDQSPDGKIILGLDDPPQDAAWVQAEVVDPQGRVWVSRPVRRKEACALVYPDDFALAAQLFDQEDQKWQ